MEVQICDSLRVVLENSPAAEEEWLWCIFCERFFQAKHLRVDFLGNRQGCAFCECAGFDCAIFHWQTWQDDPDWPKSVSELRHGLCLSDLSGEPRLEPASGSPRESVPQARQETRPCEADTDPESD